MTGRAEGHGRARLLDVDGDHVTVELDGRRLRATVTNRRLLVFPELGVYPQDYDSINPADIMKVWNVSLQGRDGILIRLRDGRCLHMLVDWSQGSKLVRDIDLMLMAPIKPRISPRLL